MHLTSINLFVLILLSTCVRAQTWKSEAEAQIRQHRTAQLRINVEGEDGQALTDAEVRVRMRESAFRWGSIMDIPTMRQLEEDGFALGDDHPYYNHLLQFNSIGPGNAGKWKQWIQPSWQEQYLDNMDWLRKNGVANRGHAPIWPSIRRWNAVPDYVLNAEAEVSADGDTIRTRERVVRDYIKAFLEDYMTTVADYDMYEVDLVNELVNEPDLSRDLLGLSTEAERIAEHTQWYKWARDAAPEIDLIVNEYNLFQSGNNFHERFVRYVRGMIELGAPIDGIGMQGHFFATVPDYAELKRRLAEVAVLGLPMGVTEFDMVSNTYAEMERVLYAIYSEPLANNFTVWGAWDGRQWRNNSAIYTRDWELKPSGEAYFDLVKDRWRTDTTLALTAGTAEVRGHHGTYDIMVIRDGTVYHDSLTLSTDTTLSLRWSAAVTEPIPEAELVVTSSSQPIYPNQPFTLAVNSGTDIAKVTFFDGRQLLGVRFADELPRTSQVRTEAGVVVSPAAEVVFTNGYRTRLTAPDFTTAADNRTPTITDLYPASGSSVILRDDLSLRLEGSDPDGDAMTVILRDTEGNTVDSTGVNGAVELPLPITEAGPYTFILTLRDARFAFTERTYNLNVVVDGASVTSLTSPIEADDDIEEREDGSIDVEGDVDLGEKVGAIRFPFTGIPRGAIIDSAFVQFTSQKSDQTGTPLSIQIGAERSGTPAPLSTANGNIGRRELVETTVQWENIPDWLILDERGPNQRTPDIGPMVQELVDLNDWSESSPVHLIFGVSGNDNKRSAYSVDQSQQYKPELAITYRADLDASNLSAPQNLTFTALGGDAGAVRWDESEPVAAVEAYEIELDGIILPAIVRQPIYQIEELTEGQRYSVRVRGVGRLGIRSPFSAVLEFTAGRGSLDCDDPDNPILYADALSVVSLGKSYTPAPGSVPEYLRYANSNLGGTTSVRRNDSTTLRWKDEGYYQRNRELGQVFTIPEGESLTLDAIVLRTGNSSSAVLENTPGAPVYLQLFEVIGEPTINDNGTPQGTESTHGFSTNHRTDDFLEGLTYLPLAILRGGEFPNIPPTTQNGGQEGHLHYLRWDLIGEGELTLDGGKRYAFMVGFEEAGPRYGFSLGNNNRAASSAAPALAVDANGMPWWSIRREGDGTLPPTQVPGEFPPEDDSLRLALIRESLYQPGHSCDLPPTTDGYPDVDTYRTLEFYIETTNSCPPAGQTCDDGNPATSDDRTDGDCGCRGVLPGGCRPDGLITYQRFNNVPGRSIQQLMAATGFPGNPSFEDTLRAFTAPGNVGDNYGARIFGYLCPPETGEYTFWVAGDDNVELNLSTDDDPSNLRRIAYHTDYTAPDEWEKFATQRSEAITLQAGIPYYVEALMNEAQGGDHLSVGWQLPSGRLRRPIGPNGISSIVGDALTNVSSPAAVLPLALYPNPATGRVTISLNHTEAGTNATLELTSVDGRALFSQPYRLQAGSNYLEFDRPVGLPAGVYVVRLGTGIRNYLARVVYTE
jgi:GH35 family endo-1,4-beta-xylanase